VGSPGSSTAYLYLGGAAGVSATPIALSPPVTTSSFGYAVAGAGDVNGDGYADFLVGSYSASATFLYLGGVSGPAVVPVTLTIPIGAFTGAAIAGAGDINGDGYADVVVGADDARRAYLFFGGASGLLPTATVLSWPEGTYYFGWSVAGAGDVDGDGYADLAVGAHIANVVYLYQGRASGVADVPITVNGPRGSQYFGYSIAGAGDVNGDGYADLAVGAHYNFMAFLYQGNASGLSTTPTSLTAPSGSTFFGFSVASTLAPGGQTRLGQALAAVGAPSRPCRRDSSRPACARLTATPTSSAQ
jgi:hypothetical protein